MKSFTKWTNGSIPKAHFPLFRDKSALSDLWTWRAATLYSDTRQYRLLVQLRQDKPNFKAWLAAQVGEDWALIARLEAHDHAGLHCHMQCLSQGILTDAIDPSNAVSIPYWKEHHRRPNGVLSERQAWDRALKFFRVHAPEELGQLEL